MPGKESPVGPAGAHDIARANWGLLAILWAIYVCHAIDRSVISVLLPSISHTFGLDDEQGGLLAGLAHSLSFAIFGIPLGALADRVHRARLLAALAALWSGLTALGALATSYGALVAARIGVGASESGAPPTMLSLLGEYFDDRRRPLAISLYYTAPFAGLTLGSAAAGAIAQWYDWRIALFAAGVPGFLLALVAWRVLPDPRTQRVRTAATVPASISEALVAVIAIRGFRSLFWALVVSSIAVSALGVWTPTLLVRAHGLSQAQAGSLTGLVLGLFGGAGSVAGGIVASLWAKGETNRLRIMSAAALIAGTPALAFGVLAGGEGGAAAGLAVWSLLSTAYIAPAWNLCVTLAPDRMRGTVLAAALVLSNLVGAGIGPWLVGRASDAFAASGDQHALPHALALLCLVALAGAGLFLLGRQDDGRTNR